MIFDIYLEIDFTTERLDKIDLLSFKDEYFYREIKGKENTVYLKNGYVVSMNRNNFNDSFYGNESEKLWVFGEVFSSKKFLIDFNIKPSRLVAKDVLELYNKYGDKISEYIKGSFVLVLYNEKNNTVKVITDRLNVLPLYYSYKAGKLIISSNTSLILKANWVDKSIDKLAFAMQSLFDYLLGEHYFVKGIRRCENARIYVFSRKKVLKKQFWDISQLYNKTLLKKNESIKLLIKELSNNVKLYSDDKEKLLVSFTGGFDGRTNIALLKERDKGSFYTYSYGMKKSKQIEIPKKISTSLGVSYKPVYLDKEFVNNYYSYSEKASYFSNGTAPIGFANIPYAYQKLEKYSDTILTGLFGSELLRPLHNNGIQVNNNSFRIFLSDDYAMNIKQMLSSLVDNNYLTNEINNDVINSLVNFFENNYFNKYKDYDKVTTFFFFILQEGIRKYFSQEISIERVYVTTRSPYFDHDFVDLIYKTPWAGIYNGFLGKSKFKRRKGQLLYAYIIKKHYPKLGKFKLDRGYTPDDLLLPFPINYFFIALGVYKAKKYLKDKKGNDTFKTEVWSKKTIKKIINHFEIGTLPFGRSVFVNPYKSFSVFTYLSYRHFLGISLFFELLDGVNEN